MFFSIRKSCYTLALLCLLGSCGPTDRPLISDNLQSLIDEAQVLPDFEEEGASTEAPEVSLGDNVPIGETDEIRSDQNLNPIAIESEPPLVQPSVPPITELPIVPIAPVLPIAPVTTPSPTPIPDFSPVPFPTPSPSPEEMISRLEWMKWLDDDLPLHRLSIPGTHDSAALEESFSATAKTQYMPVSEQLKQGMRAFDLRVTLKQEFDGQVPYLRMTHGVEEQSTRFSDIQKSLLAFLEAYPSETLVVFLKREQNTSDRKSNNYGLNQVEPFQEALLRELDLEHYYQGGSSLVSGIPTLGEARGKIVLLSRFEPEFGYRLKDWQENETFSLETQGIRFRIQDRYKVSIKEHKDAQSKRRAIDALLREEQVDTEGQWFVNFSSGTLTPVPHIIAVSDSINPGLVNLLKPYQHVGTFMMDCPEQVDGYTLCPAIVGEIISKNFTP